MQMNMRPQQRTSLLGSKFENFCHTKTVCYALQQVILQVFFVRTC